jgi:hypothetical protein
MALTEPKLLLKSVKSHDIESQFVEILQKLAKCFQNFSQYSTPI